MDSVTESHIFQRLSPTHSACRLRREVLEVLRWNIEKCLHGHQPFVACYGSYPLQTYLPNGDLDVTVVVADIGDGDALGVIREQMQFVAKIRPNLGIKGICEVNAEVRVLKLTLKSISIDISINQFGGLHTLRLLEMIDTCSVAHLFKRTLLIAKSWALYESRVAGSQYGLLASYAISVLVVCTLNTCPTARLSPIAALREMIALFAPIDWEESVITVFGIVSYADFLSGKSHCVPTDGFLFSEAHLSSLSPAEPRGKLLRRYINISDPLRPDNNLGRSVSRGSFERIRLAFHCARERLPILFPALLAKENSDSASGSSSPSTGSEEEHIGFCSLLEDAERTLRKAGEVRSASGSGKLRGKQSDR